MRLSMCRHSLAQSRCQHPFAELTPKDVLCGMSEHVIMQGVKDKYLEHEGVEFSEDSKEAQTEASALAKLLEWFQSESWTLYVMSIY